MRRGAIVLFVGISLILSACSTSPPKVEQLFWQLNLVKNPAEKGAYERLSFFVQVSLPDGLSDLDSVYVLNDGAELYWKLTPEDWETSDRDGELWVGSNRIEMADRSPLPRGRYRVILSNLSGERALTDFYVGADRLDPAAAPFPSVRVEGGRLRVESSLANTEVWTYDPAGRIARAIEAPSAEVPLSAVLPPQRAGTGGSSIYVYGYDKECGCGLISGPW